MESGKLSNQIELQRLSETVNRSGSVVKDWTTYATGRAEMRQSGVSEFLTTYGEGVENNAAFIIRWIPGVSVADRVLHNGVAWNIVAVAEIGRRRGLELRAVAA